MGVTLFVEMGLQTKEDNHNIPWSHYDKYLLIIRLIEIILHVKDMGVLGLKLYFLQVCVCKTIIMLLKIFCYWRFSVIGDFNIIRKLLGM